MNRIKLIHIEFAFLLMVQTGALLWTLYSVILWLYRWIVGQ